MSAFLMRPLGGLASWTAKEGSTSATALPYWEAASASSASSADGPSNAARRGAARRQHCSNSTTASFAAANLCAAGRILPALFIIGSLKTGTTSLWSQLVDNAANHITPGSLTDKGDVSRKEKDFFGDPTMWRRGRAWYERIWPPCPSLASASAGVRIGIDATPAYHVWHDAPKNMHSFYGAALAPRLRHVWMLRDPVAKFWSYFWELKAYRGEWDKVRFADWVAPKLARTRQCLAKDPHHPLWPPSMPPLGCAPHLDHGLYEPQLRRWLEFFAPAQFLMVSFTGYARRPAAVVRDVLLHAGLPSTVSHAAAARLRGTKNKNSKVLGRGRMPPRLRAELHALYDPMVERLYRLLADKRISVTPCEHQGSRFLDDPDFVNASMSSKPGPRRRS